MDLTSWLPRRAKDAHETVSEGYAEGHVLVGGDGTWLMYKYPQVEWVSIPHEQRTSILTRYESMLVFLVGHRIQEWVTYEPFPASEYYTGMMRRYPDASDSFREDIATAATAASAGEVHRAFLGVRLDGKRMPTRTVRVALGLDTPREDELALEDVAAKIRQIDSIVTAMGCKRLTASQTFALTESFRTFGLGRDVESIEESSSPYASTVRRDGFRDGLPVTAHVQVLRAESFEDRDNTTQWPWLSWVQTLPYRVIATRKGELVRSSDMLKSASLLARQARNTVKGEADDGFDPRGEAEDAAHAAKRTRDELASGAPASRHRFVGRVMYAVAGVTEEGAAETGRTLIADASTGVGGAGIGVELTLCRGQYSDLDSMRPGRHWPSGGHVTSHSIVFTATAAPFVSTSAGDSTGMLIGPVGGSRDMLIHDPFGATYPDLPKVHALFGEPGAGKSFFFGLLADHIASSGVRVTMNDPSGNLAKLAELPWHRRDARVVKITDGGYPGVLMPHFLIPDVEKDGYVDRVEYESEKRKRDGERASLAVQMTMGCFPPQVIADSGGRVATAVRNAVADVGSEFGTHSREIIDALTRHDRELGRLLSSSSETSQGYLIFPRGEMSPEARAALVSSARLTIVTAPGIMVPAAGLDRSEWTEEHHASSNLLLGMSRLASLSIWSGKPGPDAEPKAHFDDELGMTGSGAHQVSFLRRVSSDSRKWNASVHVAGQTPEMFRSLGDEAASLFGCAIVGRLEGPAARAAANTVLTPEWDRVISGMSKREKGTFVFKSWDGRPRLVRVATKHHRPELLAALNTTPRSVRPDVEGVFGSYREVMS